jgi:periplasmic divalent cation tolerance protein
MSTATGYCVVLTTTANEEQAETLAKKIVAEKLGACVQVQQIKSYYMWKGEACVEPECLLFVKARTEQYSALETFIKANHTYETPEIIQIAIQRGHPAYLNWMTEVTSA